MYEALVSFVADGLLLVIIVVAAPVIVWRLRGKFWSNAPVVVMAGLTSLLAGKLMSLIYQPEVARPFLQDGLAPGATYVNNPGFPSDHVLFATVIVIAVYALTKNRLLGVSLLFLVGIMGAGRILALVHTPLDVVGGAIAGLIGAVWYIKLTK